MARVKTYHTEKRLYCLDSTTSCHDMLRLASNAIQVTVYTPISIYHLNQLININFFDIAVIIT